MLGHDLSDTNRSTTLLDKLVAAGSLGKKSGLGFYRYERGERKGVNPALVALAAPKGSGVPAAA